MMSLCTAN